VIESRIYIKATEEFHPLLMFGRCVKGDLVYALTCEGRSWTRQLHETCEVFEERIVRDLRERFAKDCVSMLQSA
jgi:hypothetical protein